MRSLKSILEHKRVLRAHPAMATPSLPCGLGAPESPCDQPTQETAEYYECFATADGKATAGKKNTNLALAKQELDLGRMPLKQIIAWSYAREKARVELERHLRVQA